MFQNVLKNALEGKVYNVKNCSIFANIFTKCSRLSKFVLVLEIYSQIKKMFMLLQYGHKFKKSLGIPIIVLVFKRCS